MDKNFYIYKITNLVTGKIYIGQRTSKTLPERDRHYMGPGVKLSNSKKKHGIENFEKEILEVCTKENLNEREIFWIKELDSMNPEIGYNLVEGGRYGVTGLKGKVAWNLGIPKTAEQNERNRQAHLGVPNLKARGLKRGEQAISNMSRGAKNRKVQGRTGHNHTEESKEKNRQAHLGKVDLPETTERRVLSQKLRREREAEIKKLKLMGSTIS